MSKGKLFIGILIGLIAAVAILCIVISVGCAVNGITFGEQIVNWFGSAPKNEAVENIKSIIRF